MRVGIIIKTKFKLTKVVKCTMMMIYLRYNALYEKTKYISYVSNLCFKTLIYALYDTLISRE